MTGTPGIVGVDPMSLAHLRVVKSPESRGTRLAAGQRYSDLSALHAEWCVGVAAGQSVKPA